MQEYDVALSFAGEDRKHAKALADLLKTNGYSCFYDENELADLWGKNLYDYLSSVYKDRARYCVMFLSKHYERKLWTNHERQNAQARAFQENREYILPVRLDDTEIPGIPPTVGYLDLRSMTIEKVYETLVKKLSSPSSRKTPSDDNNVSHPESDKEKSFNQKHDQNVNTKDSKTSIGQEGVNEKAPHEKASNKPLKGFITYSHEDTTQKGELRKRLAVMEQKNEFTTWHDGEITAGDEWYEDISKNLAEADILLYLVSAASLDSKNCNKELVEALKSDIKVIPIILEHCDWQHHQLSDFEVLPLKGKPITKWDDPSEGWQNVVDGIREAINKLQSQSAPESGISQEELRAETVFHQGNVLMMLGQTDIAIEAYSEAIKISPNNPAAYNNRGVVYHGKGEVDLAIKDWSKAIELNPAHIEAYNNRGSVYNEKNEFDLAIVDLDKAIELNPNLADPYNNRGNAYAHKKDFDQAIENYTKAIELDTNYANVYYNRGSAYGKKGEFNKAIGDYTKAIQLKSGYVDAYINRGNAYDKEGEFDRAIMDFDKVIILKPDYADAYYNRGNTYNKKDEINRAIADFDKAIDLNPDFAKAYYNRGIIYDKRGEFDRAITDYTKAIDLNPDFVQAYCNRGNVYNKKGDFDCAIADSDKAIDLKPDYTEAYINRGNAYASKGEFDRAIVDFDKAIDLKFDYAEAYYNRGLAYISKERFDRAIVDFDKAIQLKSDLAEAYSNRGIAYGVKGYLDRAIVDFNKAIDLNPNYADPYSNRGNAHLYKGNFDRAIEDYTKAINVNPYHTDAYYNRGLAYKYKGEVNPAILDFTKSIDLNPNYAQAYSNRGMMLLCLQEWKKTKADLTTARNMGLDIIAEFHGIFGNIANFERIIGRQLPEDIAAMLTPLQS